MKVKGKGQHFYFSATAQSFNSKDKFYTFLNGERLLLEMMAALSISRMNSDSLQSNEIIH